MDRREKAYYLQIGHFVGTRITVARSLLEDEENADRERVYLLELLNKLSPSDYRDKLTDYLEKNHWISLYNVNRFDEFYSELDPFACSSDDGGFLERLD